MERTDCWLQGFAWKKATQTFGEKSKVGYGGYKKKYLLLDRETGLLGYFEGRRDQQPSPVGELLQGFQFCGSLSQVVTDYKGEQCKLALVVKQRMCVLRFDDAADKQRWQEALIRCKNQTPQA